jgi:hypothetical protein
MLRMLGTRENRGFLSAPTGLDSVAAQSSFVLTALTRTELILHEMRRRSSVLPTGLAQPSVATRSFLPQLLSLEFVRNIFRFFEVRPLDA